MLGFATLDFRRPNKRLIGIDITAAEINLIELGRIGKNFHVESLASQPLNAGAVMERRIRDPNEVAEALRIAYDQAEPETRRAAVAVPASAAIIKTLTLPVGVSDEEIEAHIQFGSDKYIPFPFNEVAFDYQRLETRAHSSNQQNVLLVACRQQYIDQLTEVIMTAGLEPVAVDIETLAIERALAKTCPSRMISPDEKTDMALIVIGAEMLTLHVLSVDRIVYSRDTFFAGHSPVSGLPDRYGLDSEEAEPVSLIETLAQQIDRSLQLYYTAGHYAEIRRLLLAGSASRFPGLIERLMSGSGLLAEVIDPLTSMSGNPRLGTRQTLVDDGPAMLVACGLAMREAYGV